MKKNNKNLHAAKVNKNDEFKDLTSAQKAKKRWAEKHKKPNEVYLKELRETTEGWVPIKGFERYEINREGDIYFKGDCTCPKRRRSTFIKKTLLKIGYYSVVLNGKRFFLHRLLAETFIPNPENKPEVDHIDGNPKNNALSNLRWSTHKENLNNPISVEREIKSHTGLVSNIKGRKKVWINKEEKKYKMVYAE